MVIPIDAVHYDSGLDTAGYWHTRADSLSPAEQQARREILAPARGVVCGLLLSGILWMGLIAAARAVLTVAR